MAATPLPLSRAEDLHGIPKTPSTVTPFVLEPVMSREDGEQGHPTERTSLVQGVIVAVAESLEREDLMHFLFCFLLSLFSFIICTNL